MTFWRRLQAYIGILAAFAVAYLCLIRWAGFSDRQSVALGILVALFANVLWDFGKQQDRNKFEPFTLTFAPHWYQIVDAQNLMSEAEMAKIWDEERLGGFRLLRDEFRLTRLSPALWFFNNHSAFRSRLEIHHELEELVRQADKGRALFYAPRFYFKECSDKHPKHGSIRRIEFGIITNDSIKKSAHWSEDSGNIPLGRLPDAVFNDYYADQNFSLNSKIKPAAMAELLTHYGWKREEKDYDSPLTFEKFEHRFMTVYVDSI